MNVLLAIDGSPHSREATARVATRAWPKGTTIKVLTVIHPAIPLFLEPTFVVGAAHVEQTEDLRERAPAIVGAAAEQIARTARDVLVTTEILEGHPKDVIVQAATDWNADLIVLGSHGYGRFQRMLLGSVAGAVVANAPCSVQVVRAKHLAPGVEPAA